MDYVDAILSLSTNRPLTVRYALAMGLSFVAGDLLGTCGRGSWTEGPQRWFTP
jgi:hypothetical protein